MSLKKKNLAKILFWSSRNYQLGACCKQHNLNTVFFNPHKSKAHLQKKKKHQCEVCTMKKWQIESKWLFTSNPSSSNMQSFCFCQPSHTAGHPPVQFTLYLCWSSPSHLQSTWCYSRMSHQTVHRIIRFLLLLPVKRCPTCPSNCLAHYYILRLLITSFDVFLPHICVEY